MHGGQDFCFCYRFKWAVYVRACTCVQMCVCIQRIMHSRLASDFLCSQGWSQASNPASDSQVHGTASCSSGDGTWSFIAVSTHLLGYSLSAFCWDKLAVAQSMSFQPIAILLLQPSSCWNDRCGHHTRAKTLLFMSHHVQWTRFMKRGLS